MSISPTQSPSTKSTVRIHHSRQHERCCRKQQEQVLADGYCVAVYLVKRLTSDILMQRLAKFGNRHADHSRALIKEKLAQDPDSEIATTSLRVSLLCPLGKMRMQVPCRASTCTHLQCFDATTFLMMNEKKPTWTCPVCDKPTPFNKLMIDGLFIEILGQAVDVNEITFTADGHWKPMKHVKETLVIPSPVIKEKATAAASISSPSEASPIKKPRMDVIDLTVSDDEDEDSVTTPRCVSPPVISLDSSPNGSLRSPSSYGGTPSHSITHSPPASPNSPARSNISSASSVSSSSSASSSTTLPYQNNSYSPISKPESPSPEPPPVSSISIPESRPASISSESNLLASALATNSSTSCFPPPSTSGGPSSLGVPPFPYNPIQNNYPFAIPPPPSLNPMPFDLDNLNDRDFDFLQSLLYDSR